MTREELITKIEGYSAEIIKKNMKENLTQEDEFLVYDYFFIADYHKQYTDEELEEICFELERILLILL